MIEALICCVVIAVVLLIAIVVYLHEKYWDCYHRWGTWVAGETAETYTQSRQCEKCGYTEREQWRKMK